MKKRSNIIIFIIVAISVILLACLLFFGIRGIIDYFEEKSKDYTIGEEYYGTGLDNRPRIEIVFVSDVSKDEMEKFSDEDMEIIETLISETLMEQSIYGNDITVDEKSKKITVRFPEQSSTLERDASDIANEILNRVNTNLNGVISFYEGEENDPDALVLQGSDDIDSAEAGYDSQNNYYVVQLRLTQSGTEKFAISTQKLAGTNTPISIYMGDKLLSDPTVESVITNGEAVITGIETRKEAKAIADRINGDLPSLTLKVKSISDVEK